MMRPTIFQIRLRHVVFFTSGAAGLGCQMVWTRQFAIGLGHETPALLAVVAAFFFGMTLGAFFLDRPTAQTLHPVRWYAIMEIIIGLWTLATAWLIPPINALCLDLIGLEPSPWRQGLIAFALPCLALMPATVAMGATLPLMERLTAPLTRDARCVGGLYAANTFGALTGVMLGTHLLIPTLGFRQTLWALAALDLACGVLVLALMQTNGSPASPGATAGTGAGDVVFSRRHLAAMLFSTGLLGIGYEILGVRALSQILENTVFTFAAVLSIYLLGTAVGAAWYHRRLRHLPARPLLTNLLTATAAAGALGIASLPFARRLFEALHRGFGESAAAGYLIDALLAALVFLLPTIGMGAIFSLLIQHARSSGSGLGRALACNTAGAALAGLIFSAALMPTLGLKWALVIVVLGYLGLLPKLPQAWRQLAFVSPIILLALVLPRDLGLVALSAHEHAIEHHEGSLATVTVSEHSNGVRTLRVDNRFQMGSTAALLPQRRQAHLPLLLHPLPRRALFLGPGTGITLGAALMHPDLRADAVELVPEIITVMPRFAPENNQPTRQAHARVGVADARRFVRVTSERYDVIVADVFHPARDGAGALYAQEHFAAIRKRLAPDGLFCQWLPLHQLDEPTLRSIVRTFLEVFPEAQACLLQFNVDIPVLGLIGTVTPLKLGAGMIEGRAATAALRQPLRDVSLNDTLKLLGTFVADAGALRIFAQGARLNTDDRPVVTFSAPSVATHAGLSGGDLLISLLDRWQVPFADLLDPSDPKADELSLRARKFAGARDLYLRGLNLEADGRLDAAIELFLQSSQTSLYFTPAYARCVSIISVLARTNPDEGRALWRRLEAAQPAQPLGRQILEPLLGPLPVAPKE